MNTNNRRFVSWEKEADGTQLTLDQAFEQMVAAEKAARIATVAISPSHWYKEGDTVTVSGMRDNKVFKSKHDNSKIWLAVALAMIAGSAIAVLEISGWLPQMLPTALGGGPL